MTGLAASDPVTAIDGVSGRAAGALRTGFGIRTVRDLIEHYPRRYQDRGEITDLSGVQVGEPATLIGVVRDWDHRPTRKRVKGRPMVVSSATVQADGGGTFSISFFNQRWRGEQLRPGTLVACSGKVERFRGQLQMSMPECQRLSSRDDAGVEHQRLLAVYPATAATSSMRIAGWVETALAALPPFDDYLPAGVREQQRLLPLDEALRIIHLPEDLAAAKAARRRLVFDELYTLQLGLQWRRRRLEADLAGVVNTPVEGRAASRYLDSLPFVPTSAQRRAFDQIGDDLAAPGPMHRLLQGDVGAGKTVVAIWSMLNAVDNGRQAALMVPTEVLAEQHHRTLLEQLAPMGVNVLDGLRVELLTSSTTTANRRRILGELLSGDVDLVVGTHALLEEGVRFADLGIVVIDEQHRFGVSQRVALKEKAAAPAPDLLSGPATMPDVLVMTATPIPRSLALTMYGDLDVTVLDELPPGRKPIVTQLITPAEADRRERLYDFVRDQAAQGFQTYVVCPLVEGSEELAARSAVEEHARLSGVLEGLTVELVHGRMSSGEKDAAMTRFRTGEAQVLVSTTVIEVGVDVPQATVMIIEDAERFGISQLHQLRGRVGRGADKSYCVLFAGFSADGELTEDAAARLEAVAATTDGFELADTDLEIRGEGQLFGAKQSGLPDLKLARLRRDLKIIERTQALAREVVDDDPELTSPANASLRSEVLRRYEGGLEEFAALETG